MLETKVKGTFDVRGTESTVSATKTTESATMSTATSSRIRNRRQIGDNVDCRRYFRLCRQYGRLCRRCVAGFSDCRLYRQCVPGFSDDEVTCCTLKKYTVGLTISYRIVSRCQTVAHSGCSNRTSHVALSSRASLQ